MVVPDWYLASVLGALQFPDDGVWKVGGVVSVYMSAMWSIPLLWLLVVCSDESNLPGPPPLAKLAGAACLGVLIFGAAEWLLSSGILPLQLWHCTGPQWSQSSTMALRCTCFR